MNYEYDWFLINEIWLKSRDDEVSIPLKSIVAGCTVGAVRVMDDFLGDFHKLLISGSLIEFLFQSCLVKLLKALHPRTMSHHDHALHDFFLVLSNEFETKEEQKLEVLENIWLCSFHQFHVIWCQFEGRLLESHISGRWGQYEREIDVNDMAVCVDQDVIVMPILDGEEVLDETVTG